MTGYHANDRKRCTNFVNDANYLVIDEDDTDFLGKGMYFWEHKSKAKWWLEEKKKESIVKAELDVSTLLDLTDNDMLIRINRIAEKFASAMERKGIRNGQIGLKLNYMFQAWSSFFDQFGCVRAHFYYKNRQELDFLYGSKMTGNCVDIYLVRSDPTLVTAREWVIQ